MINKHKFNIYKKFFSIAVVIWIVHLTACNSVNSNKNSEEFQGLSALFQNPPDEVKPGGYWWWLYNNVDKASITKDLEAFREKGIGSVLLVCTSNWSASPTPHGPEFLSDEWKELFLHALNEAARLNIIVDMNIAPGWNMGGPWITPENACRWFIQSELRVSGPAEYHKKLPLPGVNDGYNDPPMFNTASHLKIPFEEADYRDANVVAFRIPQNVETEALKNQRDDFGIKSARSDADCFVPALKVMAKPRQPWVNSSNDMPIDPTEVIDLTEYFNEDGSLEWDVPEGDWIIVRTGHRMTGAHLSVALPGMKGLENDFLDRAGVEQMFMHTGKVLAELAGDHAGKTLRAYCNDSFEAGYPNWTANMPKHFKRFRGYDMIPYLPVLRGFIVGSAEISERFLYDYRKTIADCMAEEHYGRFAELAGEYGIQSRAESAGPNWSSTMCMDGLKNLGRTHYPQGEFWRQWFVDGGQNMVCKQTASAAHIYGLKTASAEAFTAGGVDSLGRNYHWSAYPANLKPLADRAFCEGINNMVFHTITAQREQDGLPGYEYGAGTHFTPNVTWWDMAAGDWLKYIGRCQAMLQSGLFVADVLYYNGDWAPNLVSPKHVDPDLGPGYDYDVCNEEVLLTRLSVDNGMIVLPDGMRYRVLVLPDETRMPVEVAVKLAELVKAGATIIGPRPESDPGLKDYPQCDEQIQNIAGALWGDIDEETIAERNVGKGRVIWGRTIRDVLLEDGILPDFEASGRAGTFIDFIHRKTPDAEFYFVVNRKNRTEQVNLTFRQDGLQPELWDPVTGAQRPLPEYEFKDGRTIVPLEFNPHGSAFIVFHKSKVKENRKNRDESKSLKSRSDGNRTEESGGKNAKHGNGKVPEKHGGNNELNSNRNTSDKNILPESARNTLSFESVAQVNAPWKVSFDQEWFYPIATLSGEKADGVFTIDQLTDWSQHEVEAIRYFSGTANYKTEFTVKESLNEDATYYIDLGEVYVSASVKLNGNDLGVVWCEPWRIDATSAVKEGINQLEIEVVNCWPNRLIGDGKLSEEQRRTNTNIGLYYRTKRNGDEHQLLPSGLMGPVKLVLIEES